MIISERKIEVNNMLHEMARYITQWSITVCGQKEKSAIIQYGVELFFDTNLIYDGLSSIPSGNYKIYANYVPGYIPGCEPRHSAPCNAGYWQYSATRS